MNSSSHSEKEGTLAVSGGNIWYKVVGGSNKTPLIVLHGGPGFPHNSLLPLAALADERPVVFYDQLGCGKSDRPADESLWTFPRYVEELSLLISELGFERFNLFGHSWGTMLALEYYQKYPSGIEKLIFASPVFSASKWEEDGATYVQELSEEYQAVIKAHDTGEPFDLHAFKDAEAEYNRRHLCRLDPWPKDLKQSVAGLGLDVYRYMWGDCEWKPFGTLKSYESIDKLQNINIPVLLTCGWYDNPPPETTAFYTKQIPGAKIKVFENSSHSAFLEDRDDFIKTVREFLD